MAGFDVATGKWRAGVVSTVFGAVVASLCGAAVFAVTSGAGVLALSTCAAIGIAAGELLAKKVKASKYKPRKSGRR